jgi:putative translation initiation factor SUI1
MDNWLDSLQSLRDTMADADATAIDVPDCDAPTEERQTGRLDIVLERKGRAGKTATIITGFTVSDDAVADIASQLKRSLGTGGSARGGEILIQGDRRKEVLARLTALGLKARII